MIAQEDNSQSRLIAGLAQQSSEVVHVGLDLVVAQRGQGRVGGKSVEAEKDARDEVLVLLYPFCVDQTVGIQRRDGAQRGVRGVEDGGRGGRGELDAFGKAGTAGREKQ